MRFANAHIGLGFTRTAAIFPVPPVIACTAAVITAMTSGLIALSDMSFTPFDYRGIFPCFFAGPASRLLAKALSAVMMYGR